MKDWTWEEVGVALGAAFCIVGAVLLMAFAVLFLS